MTTTASKAKTKVNKKANAIGRGGRTSRNGDGTHYNGVALPTDSLERRRVRNKLSAMVFRKKKQDALNTAKEEVAKCDTEIERLKLQLDNTGSKITSLQSIMDIIQLEFGAEAVQHILKQCNQAAEGGNNDIKLTNSPTVARSVSSESDHMISSHSSDDDSSLGCFKEESA